MTDRELMQQALDALIETVRLAGEYGTHLIRNDKDAGHAYETIEALRARLAEPEVGVCCQEFDKCLRSCTPRGQWIARVYCGCGDQIMRDDGAECGTCVTARNAVKQEPLAQMKEMLEVQGRDGTWNYDPYLQGMFNGMEFMVALAEGRDPVFREAPEKWLHTPPQRKWQTLTENEIKHLWYEACQTNLELTSQLIVHLARNIEAKLKEKNHV